jgi:heptosyltransferase I
MVEIQVVACRPNVALSLLYMSESLVPTNSRALLIRLDRIGDLVLSLPVDQRLEEHDIHWWIPSRLAFVTLAASPRRVATEITKMPSLYGFFRMFQSLRRDSFSIVIIFHAPWWISLLVWLARIPVRVGVLSQWHSFLFFNRGVRQKRSRAEMNELDYNLDLVERGLALQHRPIGPLVLKPDLHGVVEAHGLKPLEYYVVHPGMGGSALNWPVQRYAELIQKLSSLRPVVITGTASDAFILEPLKAACEAVAAPLKDGRSFTTAGLPKVLWLNEKLSGADLLEILAQARGVVAPSTGVVHLAAACGVPTVGIYSPIRVEHPTRWGPKGPRAEVLVPDLRDGENPRESMEKISVDQVLNKLEVARSR